MLQNLQNFAEFQKCQLDNLVDLKNAEKRVFSFKDRCRYSRNRANICQKLATGSAPRHRGRERRQRASPDLSRTLLSAHERLANISNGSYGHLPNLAEKFRGREPETSVLSRLSTWRKAVTTGMSGVVGGGSNPGGLGPTSALTHHGGRVRSKASKRTTYAM